MAGTLDSLDFLVQAMETIPGMVQAGMDAVQIATYAAKITQQVRNMQAQNRGPTQAEWDDLNAVIKGDRDRLHAP